MSPDRATSFLSFLARTFWPFLAFLVLLSIGLNAFFLTVERFRQAKEPPKISAPASTTGAMLQELVRGPKAFGAITYAHSLSPQSLPQGVTLPPISVYEVPSEKLPSLPPDLVLYRDQGVDIDTVLFHDVFRKLGAPFNLGLLQFFADSLSFHSSDRSLAISIDVPTREISIRRFAEPAATAPSGIADDAESIAIAKDFTATIGLGSAIAGDARTVDSVGADGKTVTHVIWDVTIDGVPLLDTAMHPVPKVRVTVDRTARRASAVTVKLFEPGLLARSAYPVAPAALLTQRLRSGGLLPLAANKKLKASGVTYSSISLAYVLLPSTDAAPTYLVPILKAAWVMDPGCKGCVPVKLATFTPALSPQSFVWKGEKDL